MPSRNDVYTKPASGREERLAQVAELVVVGKSNAEVSAVVGVSTRQVQRDRKLLEARWQLRSVEATDTWKGRLVARYEKTYSEAMAAWELSLQPATKTQVRTEPMLGKEGGTRIVGQTVTKIEGRGNGKMLEVALAALGGLANVLGLNDPQVAMLVVQRYLAIAADDLGMDPADFMTQVEAIAGEAWERAGLPQKSEQGEQ